MNIVDAIRDFADANPEHPALVFTGADRRTEWAYASLIEEIDRIAARLRDAGIERGHRVGVTAPQSATFIATALATIAVDACLVPLPEDLSTTSRDEFCRRAHLHFLVTTPRDLGAAQAIEAVTPTNPLEPTAEAEFARLAPAYLRFTSGTTNTRKGVVLGHDGIATRLDRANSVLGIGPSDRILWLLPMAHHFVVSILLYLRAGATVLLPAHSLAASILEMAEAERATVMYASPYHYGLLASGGDSRGADTRLAHLRLAVSTAEHLREATADAFRARFDIAVVQALGIIEVGLPVINHLSAATKPEALGRPVDGYDVWLRGEDGNPVPDSSAANTGEICIRADGIFDAYLDPWLSSASMPEGFRTGDQGWFDNDGDLHLAGRRTNRINMAGMKFFCEEVERVLDSHPGVERSLVYARAHPRLGEIPVADVVLSDASLEETVTKSLRAYCREHLAPYMIPREYRVVEALAQTATGKVARTRP